MKLIVLILAVVLCSIPSTTRVSALECYTCSSLHSNCLSQKSDCDDDTEACQKKTEGEAVEKMCTKYQSCLAEQRKCRLNNTCNVYCCTDPYCNDSTSLRSTLELIYILLVITWCYTHI